MKLNIYYRINSLPTILPLSKFALLGQSAIEIANLVLFGLNSHYGNNAMLKLCSYAGK